MNPTFDAFVRSWPREPWTTLALAITAVWYARGWRALRRRDRRRFTYARLAAMLAGLGAIFLALASPIEPFASLLLEAHMVQHLLLTMAAPPLLWYAAPLAPLVRGAPRAVRVVWLTPLLRHRGLRRTMERLVHPLVAWPFFVAATWLWHAPRAYELALRQADWHVVEHACFLVTALVFWYPVMRPFPCRPAWSTWLLLPYLLLADVQNTALSAWLTFSSRPVYAYYTEVPRVAGISALDDQHLAGVLMWVPGSIVYLAPLAGIGLTILYGSRTRPRAPASVARAPRSIALPILTTGTSCGTRRIHRLEAPSAKAAWDLLDVPLVGNFLRRRWARPAMQGALAVLAALVVVDGLLGPAVTPMNLAGVLPWIHWRGIVVFGLLVAGNLFCMACPFALPRSLGRRWLPRAHAWPRWLRSKWLSVALVVAFLWSYEALAPWDSPWWTAWIAIGYFVAAFAVDGWFRGAAFCKYVCPIGQFNFVHSLVSPLEVKVREPAVCADCQGLECIRGAGNVPGCEMQLFQPRKQGNLDCTFCLDCVHACPHGNVGLLAVTPGAALWSDARASGIGRLSQRPDLAMLALVLACGAFANAGGMVAPVARWCDEMSLATGLTRTALVSIYYLIALVALPLATMAAVGVLARRWGHVAESWPVVATRYCYALVPLGFAMWLAHYSLHLLTSYDAAVPAAQRLARELGWSWVDEPEWQRACCLAVAEWIPRFEIMALDVGMLGSLYVGYRIALAATARCTSGSAELRAIRAWAPLALVVVGLFAVGVWTVLQPMEMRGTLPRVE